MELHFAAVIIFILWCWGGLFNGVWKLQTWMWQHAAIQRRAAAAAAAPGRQEARTAPGGGTDGGPAADGEAPATLQHYNASHQVRILGFLCFLI